MIFAQTTILRNSYEGILRPQEDFFGPSFRRACKINTLDPFYQDLQYCGPKSLLNKKKGFSRSSGRKPLLEHEMELIKYLEVVGQCSGEKLIDAMGEGWDSTELFDLIDRGVVSSSYGSHGARYFRYPAVAAGTTKSDDSDEHLGRYIEKYPGLDGREILDAMGWSKDKFLKNVGALMDRGEVYRKKKGTSWLYFPKLLPLREKVVQVSDDRDGRFKNEKVNRTLTSMEERIVGCLGDDDREADHMAEDLGYTEAGQIKTFKQSLSRLYRDGFVGKVIDGDSTWYCQPDRV